MTTLRGKAEPGGDVLPWTTVEEFYRLRRNGLVVRLFYMLWCKQDAEDTAQEAFIQAAKNWHTLRGDDADTVTAWLYRIAARLALTKLRQRKRRNEVALDDVAGPAIHHLVSSGLPPDRAYELVSTAVDVLGNLSPRQREIYLLRHYFGLDVADIAHHLRCAASTVRVHLHRAQETITRAGGRSDEPAAAPTGLTEGVEDR